MESLPTAILRPGEADRIIAGHPWIYSGAILRITHAVSDGGVVQIKDHRQRFLGVGLFNSRSRIAVRVLSPERIPIDRAFFDRSIRTALEVRQRLMPQATSFRVVNSESDSLSGLIVDKYDDVLVLQTSSLGMDQRKADILAVLQGIFNPRAILERNDIASRKFEGLADAQGVLAGRLDGPVTVRLNGLGLATDLQGGHKTGLYLDQQANYQAVADFVGRRPGAAVLDCFSFMGGFALHAARAGAGSVHALDQSEEANRAASQNAAANGLADRCTFETTNVFDWLKARTQTRPNEKLVAPFDAIVLDPPSFTRTRETVVNALRGYKEIHIRALRLLRPGGLLATFCCSHHVDANTFMDVILAAAFDSRRVLRRVATFSQSPDHPVIPSIPETEYLKGYAFELVR
jgi:23S rRNA (cytosine1962-C5)-methyltransferase